MTVYSADGHKLGKVVRSDASGIIIEKGIFFIKDYVARHEDIAAIEGDDVRLAVNRDGLPELGADEALGSAGGRAVGAVDAPDAGIAPRSFDTATLGAGNTRPEGVRAPLVPVVEEEISERPLARGEVRVIRTPHVEQRAADGAADDEDKRET